MPVCGLSLIASARTTLDAKFLVDLEKARIATHPVQVIYTVSNGLFQDPITQNCKGYVREIKTSAWFRRRILVLEKDFVLHEIPLRNILEVSEFVLPEYQLSIEGQQLYKSVHRVSMKNTPVRITLKQTGKWYEQVAGEILGYVGFIKQSLSITGGYVFEFLPLNREGDVESKTIIYLDSVKEIGLIQ